MEKLKKFFKEPSSLIVVICVLIAFGCLFTLNTFRTNTVEAQVINVKKTPKFSSETLKQITAGSTVKIIESLPNDWQKVRMPDDSIGYINTDLTANNNASAATNMKIRVTSKATLFDAPEASSNKIKTLAIGSKAVSIGQSNAFNEIVIDNKTYYIESSKIKLENLADETFSFNDDTTRSEPIKTVVPRNETTKLYKKNDITSKSVSIKKDNLKFLGKSGEFYRVKSREDTGYIPISEVDISSNDKPVKYNNNNLYSKIIVLDPGHGGNDTGAYSPKNTYEKTFTLQTAIKTGNELKRYGAIIVYTRNDKKDEFIDLKPRSDLANQLKANAFISFHFDSSPERDEASGTTTYYYHADTSIQLADSINYELSRNLPLENRGVKFGDFYVIRENKQPSVLLELGFINSNNDYKYIKTIDYQSKIANSVTSGLINYFNTISK